MNQPVPSPHASERIAHSKVAAVDNCSCGTLHVHVGSITLHMTPQALDTFARTLVTAAMKLDESREDGFTLNVATPAGTC